MGHDVGERDEVEHVVLQGADHLAGIVRPDVIVVGLRNFAAGDVSYTVTASSVCCLQSGS